MQEKQQCISCAGEIESDVEDEEHRIPFPASQSDEEIVLEEIEREVEKNSRDNPPKFIGDPKKQSEEGRVSDLGQNHHRRAAGEKADAMGEAED